MSWTSDGIYVPRSMLMQCADGSVVGEPTKEEEFKHLQKVLYDVLRQFPEAYAAVLQALEEDLEAERAEQRNRHGGV